MSSWMQFRNAYVSFKPFKLYSRVFDHFLSILLQYSERFCMFVHLFLRLVRLVLKLLISTKSLKKQGWAIKEVTSAPLKKNSSLFVHIIAVIKMVLSLES